MKEGWVRRGFIFVLLVCVGGCTHYPVNAPKTENVREGYYFDSDHRENNSDEIIFLMAFSGGGTRAASFSYGLLEALRDVTYETEGRTRRMLDEVDVISSVSGGSFTSAAYALYGDEIFDVFESAFLYRNVQKALVWKALNPLNWPTLSSSTYSISDLAAEYYDKILFKGATFDNLRTNNTPHIIINATDLSNGNRLSFNQTVFDVIASDLGSYPLSRAVAASSAVPGLLSPITLNNYAGQYPVEQPKWLQRSYNNMEEDPVRVQAARMALYTDSASSPYIHLVDGSASDNLGLRCYLDISAILRANPELLSLLDERGAVRKVVLISVNSFVTPKNDWDKNESPPKSKEVGKAAGYRTMEQYSMDTLVDTRRLIRDLKPHLESQEEIKLYQIELDFMKVKDPSMMRSLLSLPTSFSLQQDVVGDLRQAARSLLYESEEFQRLIGDLGGTCPEIHEPEKKSSWWRKSRSR